MITSQGSNNSSFRLSPGWLFVFPYLLFLVAFGVGPALYIVVISFFDTKNPTMTFNGFENYQTVIADFRFLESLRNPVLFTLL